VISLDVIKPISNVINYNHLVKDCSHRMQRHISLGDINSYLICTLCSGYLVDATTLVECLHSFCRSCLLKYLEISFNCPKCNTEIHKTKPLEYIRSDPSLQEIAYKLVPDLYSNEETQRKVWENQNSDSTSSNIHESYNNKEDSRILVTLKYFRGTSRVERLKAEKVLNLFPTRYLCCQPDMPIHVLKKFVMHKFDISTELFELDIWRGDETLVDGLTLKSLVQMYGLYRERKPMELHFSLYPKFEMKKDVPKPVSNKTFPKLDFMSLKPLDDISESTSNNLPDTSLDDKKGISDGGTDITPSEIKNDNITDLSTSSANNDKKGANNSLLSYRKSVDSAEINESVPTYKKNLDRTEKCTHPESKNSYMDNAEHSTPPQCKPINAENKHPPESSASLESKNNEISNMSSNNIIKQDTAMEVTKQDTAMEVDENLELNTQPS